jgi:hypothetical protein
MNSNTIFQIQEDIDEAELSFNDIASKHGVTVEDVYTIWDDMCRQMDEGMYLSKGVG